MEEIKAELYHYSLTCPFKIRPADTSWKISRSALSTQFALYSMYSIADTFLKGTTSWRFKSSLVFIPYFLFLLASVGLQLYLTSDVTRIKMRVWSMIKKPKLLPSTLFHACLVLQTIQSRVWLPTQMCLLSFYTLRLDIPDIQCSYLWGCQIWCRSCTQMPAGRGVWKLGGILWRVSDKTRCSRVSSKNILQETKSVLRWYSGAWLARAGACLQGS